jgi:hypothetical protein
MLRARRMHSLLLTLMYQTVSELPGSLPTKLSTATVEFCV